MSNGRLCPKNVSKGGSCPNNIRATVVDRFISMYVH